MFDGRIGPDPFVFYKFHHVQRAQMACLLSEDLGLYEALRDGPASLGELCSRTGLPRRPATVLLAANACVGIVGHNQGRYFLFDELRDRVLEGGRARRGSRFPTPEENPQYHGYRQAILTNRPLEEQAPDWVRCPQGAPEVTAFDLPRHGWRTIWGESLAQAFDFRPYRLVVDLGGATGGVLVGLTSRYAGLQGIVYDLPYSQASAEEAIRSSGASERVRFVAGDFFQDPFPAGADVLFMSHVLHDWDDEHCLHLLRRCCQALPPGSPVLTMEFLLNDDKTGPLLAVFQWFGLLDGTMGDQRTGPEIVALMIAAGFRRTEIRRVDTEHSIVVGWK